MGKQEKPPKSYQRSGGVHAGHRSRVRQRFLTGGLESFQDHEVLELILFYAIPRKDVNETAHMLIDRFGSLAAVLDAPEEELRDVPGVGPHVAHFLNLIPQIMVQMARQSMRGCPHPLYTPGDLVELMGGRCPPCPMGHVLLILANTRHEPVAIHAYERFEDLTIQSVAAHATSSRAAMAMLVERVEDCTAFPLPGRLEAISELARRLDVLEVPLWDCFTVDFLGHPPHSFARSGQLLPR